MRVLLKDELFDVQKRPLDVLGLIGLAVRMGHIIGTRERAVSAWARVLSPTVGAAAELLLTQHRARLGLTHAGISIAVGLQESNWSTAELELEDAWRFLRSPLELLLENERGDWHFLRRLATPNQRNQMEVAMEKGRLVVRQGGGISELKKSVEDLFSHPADLQIKVRRLRSWVLFDRDADRQDNRQPHKTARDTQRACQRTVADDPWNLGFHRLKRRHIESYLPDRLLKTWSQGKQLYFQHASTAYTALRKTNPDAADSLHMKEGLRKAFGSASPSPLPHANSPNRSKRQQDEATLKNWPAPWTTVPAEIRADLLAGFGRDIGKLYKVATPGYDADLRDEFGNREGISAQTLINSLLERL